MNQQEFIQKLNDYFGERFKVTPNTIQALEQIVRVVHPKRDVFRRNPEYDNIDLQRAIKAIDTKINLQEGQLKVQWLTVKEMMGTGKKGKEH